MCVPTSYNHWLETSYKVLAYIYMEILKLKSFVHTIRRMKKPMIYTLQSKCKLLDLRKYLFLFNVHFEQLVK